MSTRSYHHGQCRRSRYVKHLPLRRILPDCLAEVIISVCSHGIRDGVQAITVLPSMNHLISIGNGGDARNTAKLTFEIDVNRLPSILTRYTRLI